jgi:hypothetical protein
MAGSRPGMTAAALTLQSARGLRAVGATSFAFVAADAEDDVIVRMSSLGSARETMRPARPGRAFAHLRRAVSPVHSSVS